MESDTDGEQQSDTIVASDPIVDPPLDGSDEPMNAPIGDPRGVVAPNRVIGGVAADVASRLGVDPLWVRLAFVALIAFGGLGFVLYAGLWLVLIVGARPGWAPVRYLGAGALAIAWAVVFNEGSFLLDNAVVTVVLLTGVAVALWQPRGVPARAVSDPLIGHGRPGWSGHAPAFAPRERSVFGRWVLAGALLVAAGGALVDQLNDGRTHPEQWLGAAAAICGLGVLVSAFRGRAYWLTVPALALGAAGFLAGHAARAGVTGEIRFGDVDYYVQPEYENLPKAASTIAGRMRVHIQGAPADQNRSDLRVGVGVIHIEVAWDVTAEIRATLHDGEASIDGVPIATPEGEPVLLRVGPEGEPDVIIDAVVSHGNVRVTTGPSGFDSGPPMATTVPFVTVPGFIEGTTTDIGEGFRMLRDGTVLFPVDGPEMGTTDMTGTIITPDGLLSTNLPTEARAGGTTAIVATDLGGMPAEYIVLPNQMILTPNGTIIDVPAARERLAEPDHNITATTEF